MTRRDYKGDLETYLTFAPRAHGLDWELEREVRFHPTRRWRFDWAWSGGQIAIEYDGIMGGHASHSSMAGILRDSEKLNHAQLLGWRVFRANARTVGDGTFFELIDSVLLEKARAA